MYAKNNEHMNPNTFVWTDGVYDYCIVNGESVTKYYGEVGGEYESYPLHHFMDIRYLPNWVISTIDKGWEIYKHKAELKTQIDELSTDDQLKWASLLSRWW